MQQQNVHVLKHVQQCQTAQVARMTNFCRTCSHYKLYIPVSSTQLVSCTIVHVLLLRQYVSYIYHRWIHELWQYLPSSFFFRNGHSVFAKAVPKQPVNNVSNPAQIFILGKIINEILSKHNILPGIWSRLENPRCFFCPNIHIAQCFIFPSLYV